MEKTKVWSVPEGYELDKDQSTETKVVLRKIENKSARSWEEYCKKIQGKDSYFYNNAISRIEDSQFGSEPFLPEFKDKEDVEALVAFFKLIHLRRDWIGEWKPDWASQDSKFIITTFKNNIEGNINYNASRSLSFPTEEMRNEFIVTFKDLLEIAKSLL